jgi:hypothetical protein
MHTRDTRTVPPPSPTARDRALGARRVRQLTRITGVAATGVTALLAGVVAIGARHATAAASAATTTAHRATKTTTTASTSTSASSSSSNSSSSLGASSSTTTSSSSTPSVVSGGS